MDEHCALSAIVAQNPFIFDGAHSSVSLKPFDCIYTPLRPEGQTSPHDNSVHFPPPRIQQEALTDTSDCSALFSSESSFAVPRDERNSGAKIVTWIASLHCSIASLITLKAYDTTTCPTVLNSSYFLHSYSSSHYFFHIRISTRLCRGVMRILLRLQMPWLVSAQDLLLAYQISAFYGKAWIPSPTTTVSLVLSRLGEQAMKSMHFWLDA